MRNTVAVASPKLPLFESIIHKLVKVLEIFTYREVSLTIDTTCSGVGKQVELGGDQQAREQVEIR